MMCEKGLLRRRRRGFTLIEIFAVVTIIALLAAVAISSMRRNIKRSRTSEAMMNLNSMWDGAVAYFNTLHATADGQYIAPQFPGSAPMTPERPPDGSPYEPTEGNWDHPAWDALNFSMASPHYFQYGFLNLIDSAPPGGGGAVFGEDGAFGSAGGPLGDEGAF